MRKNERERLARRAAYQRDRELAKPHKVALPEGMTVEEFNERSDISTACHEAGHAVAAWMQDIDAKISYVPRGTLTNGKDFSAITVTHPDYLSFITEPSVGSLSFDKGIIRDSRGVRVGAVNDGGVTGFKEAFITLAGPFAELFALGEVLPEDDYNHQFQIHGDEARGKLMHFTLNPQVEEIKAALKRIADLVETTFQEPRVITCVRALAERFHKARKLNEKEVRETIETAWAGWSEQAEAAKAGK